MKLISRFKGIFFILILFIIVVGAVVFLKYNEFYRGNNYKDTIKYSVNAYNETDDEKSYMVIGRKINRSIKLFDDKDKAKKAFQNTPIYLKNKIDNSLLTESYVCFEKNGENYCLKGTLYSQSFEDKKETFTYNKIVLETAFDSSQCEEERSVYICNDGSIHALTFMFGTVSAYIEEDDNKIGCLINSGIAYCSNRNCDFPL